MGAREQFLLSAAVGIPFGFSLLAPFLTRLWGSRAAYVLAVAPIAVFAIILQLPSFGVCFPWVPDIGLYIGFKVDALSRTFALLASGVGAGILVFSAGYMQSAPKLGRFYALLMLFMGAMLGLVLANTALNLFVFWELTSWSSYLLIGTNHESATARRSALVALGITSVGGFALLLAACVIGSGSLDLYRPGAELSLVSGLLLVAAWTKSAQVPLHSWLPGAMSAPTPVSAYLHSATMVQAGVYLVARMSPILGGWFPEACQWLGCLTAIAGTVMMVRQTDLKRILAYTTLSALGLLFAVASGGTTEALLVFLVAHGLYKAGLFMVAGTVDHETGTRNIRELSGLRKAMPFTFAGACLCGFAAASLPPSLSFVGKELLHGLSGLPIVLAGIAAGAGGVLGSWMVVRKPFFGEPSHDCHDGAVSMWLPIGVCGLVGLGAAFVDRRIVEALSALLHGPAVYLITLGLGFGLIVVWERSLSKLDAPVSSSDRVLDGLCRLSLEFAPRFSRVIQNGLLSSYARSVLAATCLLVAISVYRWQPVLSLDSGLKPELLEGVVIVVTILSAFATLVIVKRISAVACISVVGMGIATLYSLYGAPDLAMTQIAVETLTLILFITAFYHFPKVVARRNKRRRLQDGVVAVAVGVLMMFLSLAASNLHPSGELSRFFSENALPVAQGQNVVNVILVDFRALDTMGEITVMAVAGLGVYALLKKKGSVKAEEEGS